MGSRITRLSGAPKIGFIIPWFGRNCSGGAEMQCAALARELTSRGASVEVLTTCSKSFQSDWNENYWKPGIYVEDDITVRRFKVKKRNQAPFDAVNAKLMGGIRVTPEEEIVYMNEMIHSPAMVRYLSQHIDDYHALIAIPYMFGTTYDVLTIAPEKTYMIPCLHDEQYAYMNIYQEPFRAIRGFFFNTGSEATLAKKLFSLSDAQCHIMGEGVDPIIASSGGFKKQYALDTDYILYAGRKDAGKNVFTLVDYFDRFIRETKEQFSLVLIGSGRVDVPEQQQRYIIDLGLLSSEDKQAAFSDAAILCQPSLNESFSIVLMEAWSVQKPVLVNEQCAVLKEHVLNSNGGLMFGNYEDFREALLYLIKHREEARIMGTNGEKYYRTNFHHSTVTERYVSALIN